MKRTIILTLTCQCIAIIGMEPTSPKKQSPTIKRVQRTEITDERSDEFHFNNRRSLALHNSIGTGSTANTNAYSTPQYPSSPIMPRKNI